MNSSHTALKGNVSPTREWYQKCALPDTGQLPSSPSHELKVILQS